MEWDNTKRGHRRLTAILAALAFTGSAPLQAAATFELDDSRWISLGAGLRTSFNAVENAAPGGSGYSKDFELDSIRLYVKGQIHEFVKFTFNTERDRDGDDDIRALDVIARFEFSPAVNLWGGRLLPPTDRLNLDGPYYLLSWNLPRVHRYPAIFAGRDDGAVFWGTQAIADTRIKYQLGAFEGCSDSSNCNTGANTDDNLLYAGRITLNLLDPESGYNNRSTYYGRKDILALGLTVQTQKDAVGTAADPEDFLGWNLDALFEKKLTHGGVISLEGAYYDFDTGDATVTGALVEGSSHFVQGAFLFPQKLGIGQLQPYLQHSTFDPDTGGETDKWEAGLNYIVKGNDAKISAVVGNIDPEGSSSEHFFTLGVQLQI